MTREHLTKLWIALSLAAFVSIVGSVIVLQGGVDIFGARLPVNAEKDGKAAVGYFVGIIGGTLLSLAFAVAILHARRHGSSWHDRLPVVWLEGLNTRSGEGQAFQAMVLIVLVVIPLIGLGRSIDVANDGWLCEQGEADAPPRWYKGGEWRLTNLPPYRNQLRLMGDSDAGDCKKQGVELGWFTPIVFVFPPAIAFLLAIKLVAVLIWSRVAMPRPEDIS